VTAPLPELSEEELAWVAASTAAMLRQAAPSLAHVGFDDPPDGLLAVLHCERP
jgi:hypothetical protein